MVWLAYCGLFEVQRCVVGLFPIRLLARNEGVGGATPARHGQGQHLVARRRRREGDKEILKSGKLYDESVDMQVVIKSAMDKAAAQAERSLCL